MEPVVLSLGGSVLVREEGDTAYIRKLAKILIGISSNFKLYVVTGGGKIARYYIRAGRDLGASESFLDESGIEVTRLNARLLITALGDHACHTPPKNYDDAVHAGKTCSIVVMGGVSPGITTDAVSALLAERVKARRLVNATSVDGAYTADPKKDPSALAPTMSLMRSARRCWNARRYHWRSSTETIWQTLGMLLRARSSRALRSLEQSFLDGIASQFPQCI
jgi:uridylate kinase